MATKFGLMQVTFKVPCVLSEVVPDKLWISNLLRQNPDLTGWPFFTDLWTPRQPGFKPRYSDGVWEARLVGEGDDPSKVDHWRIDGKNGLFYAARSLEDDTVNGSPNPGQTVEFALIILRVAEILNIAISFSNYLCDSQGDKDANVTISFAWSGLNERVLSNWANPARYLSENYQCHVDSVKKIIELPLGTSQDQLVLFTQEVVNELFLHFDGWRCPIAVIEDLVTKLLTRKL